jgi:hypothetical protein
MLVGNCFAIGAGGIVVGILTLLTTKPLNVDQVSEVWEKTRDIDSPLLPWTEIYARLVMYRIQILFGNDLKNKNISVD